MTRNEMAGMIDQTNLSPCSTKEKIESFLNEALKYNFASVCINPVWVPLASSVMKGSETKVCTVIDFPLGAGSTDSKKMQARDVISKGADELDYVVDLSLVKAHRWKELSSSLCDISQDAKNFVQKKSLLLKLIIETCFLEDDEIKETCLCAKDAGFDFVKTSTGFAILKNGSANGATVHAVSLMRKTVGDKMGVKASGGIHTTEEALALVDAGANRIGASSGIAIVEGLSE
ncbi:MAG: deoxyribose-phosphate aldolase [Treponema sp.]|nr:deoxyribose-phosphate aldolase [Treponema sp.]